MLWQGSHLGGSDGGGSAIDTTGRRSVTQPTDKPTIAVLPFDNFSSPADSHFADGLAEDLITDLSKLRGLNVIARTSSYALRGQSLAAHEIGKRLGARYLVEGSYRKEADRIRVNDQLIDTETGQHRWAERWDRPADDILKVQDELTGKIVAMLDVQLSEGEQASRWRRQTHDPIAYELFLLGRSHKLKESRDGVQAAIPLLQQAVDRDPDFAAAWVWLGWAYWAYVYSGWTDQPDEYRQKAIDAAHRGRSLPTRSSAARTRSWPTSPVSTADWRKLRDKPEKRSNSIPAAPTISPSSPPGAVRAGRSKRPT
jgi:TolB-like protein